jgi:mitochondrial fission protein ELM1
MKALGITDGSAGMEAQVRALAEAMQLDVEMLAVKVNSAWKILPNIARDIGLHLLFPVTPQKIPPAGIIISCGRKGALVSATIKNRAKRIHIQAPQMSPKHFDVVIAMEHDNIQAANILQTPYALHNITPEKLASAQAHWQPKFEHLQKPWNAVLIGGSTNKYTLGGNAMRELIAQIEKIEGSLLITTSRRTGEENIKLLTHHFGGRNNKVFLYTGEVENPYMGMLACADKIYATNDSVNMMSEAIASGKPTFILPLLGHNNTKPARFAETLNTQRISPQAMMKELASSVRQMLS